MISHERMMNGHGHGLGLGLDRLMSNYELIKCNGRTTIDSDGRALISCLPSANKQALYTVSGLMSTEWKEE
jgi:hypothetical protein